ncbi:sorting nexin-25-like [Amphiura filiformis]|uniref:sorting nexin-25-like n=1 Tax=Amphiura filiformis TaxID=82378 RepID=UPI003B21D271
MKIVEKIVNVYSIAAVGVILAICYQTGFLQTLPRIWVYVAVGVLGFSLGVVLVIFSGKERSLSVTSDPPRAANVLIMKVMEMMTRRRKKPRKVVTSRNMEKAINEVFELIVRDYVFPWYKKLGKDDSVFVDALQDDLWVLIENLKTRLQRVDKVRFLTSDVVYKLCEYFQQLRECSASRNSDTPTAFYLHPCLASEATETQFLREMVEVMLVLMLPRQISGCETARHLLREIVTCTVLKPAIDALCDPVYINHNLLSYLEHREQLVEKNKRNYSYAATYEEFVKLINMCNDLEELQQIRYHIINEIMQVTIIQELKKTRGQEAEKTLKGTGKAGDLLRARDLNRYINQCKVAKSQCEKRIRILGGLDYQSYYQYKTTSPLELNRQPVLSLNEILMDSKSRDYFRSFLKRTNLDDLIPFWVAVEYMKGCKKLREQLNCGNEIYQTFVATSSAIHVAKEHVAGIEAFLVGNKGPESFYHAQQQIYQQLDEDHYPSFLISEPYSKLMDSRGGHDDDGGLSEEMLEKKGLNVELLPSPEDEPGNTSVSIAEQTDAVMSKLQQVEEKLNHKTQALSNLKSTGTHSSESKMQQMLEKEIEMLKLERRELEQYVERTDLWCEYAGKWRIDICASNVLNEADKLVPYYVIVVHPTDPKINISGWVVSRRLTEFYNLQKRLKECSKWLSKVELPHLPRKLFKSIDEKFLNTSSSRLQKYLTSILQDETLRHSEALYTFLVPSPLSVKIDITQKKERKQGFLTGIFKNAPQDQEEPREDYDGDEEGSQDRKDSIAEPIYALISEIFELRGMFKWLRRNFIVFVQVTLGGTINKSVREGVEWMVSEPMLVGYIHYFRDSYWPKGQLAPPYPVFTEEQKQQTKDKAREKFLRYFPDYLQTLLGKRNSKLGARKVFEAIQDKTANKHLFYNLMEIALLELCPELKDPKLLARVQAEEKKRQQTNQPNAPGRDEQTSQYDGNLRRPVLVNKPEVEGQSSDDEDQRIMRSMQRTTGSGAESGEETT